MLRPRQHYPVPPASQVGLPLLVASPAASGAAAAGRAATKSAKPTAAPTAAAGTSAHAAHPPSATVPGPIAGAGAHQSASNQKKCQQAPATEQPEEYQRQKQIEGNAVNGIGLRFGRGGCRGGGRLS